MVEGADVDNAGDSEKHINAGDSDKTWQYLALKIAGNEHVRADCPREMVVQLPGPGH